MVAVEEGDGAAMDHHIRMRIAGEHAALLLRLRAEIARRAERKTFFTRAPSGPQRKFV
jgi:hypothetical protein